MIVTAHQHRILPRLRIKAPPDAVHLKAVFFVKSARGGIGCAHIEQHALCARADDRLEQHPADAAASVAASHGKDLKLLVQRDEKQINLTLTPVFADNDSTWRAGVWVRDSSAGIGTMTYWDPQSGQFGGLGHAICDVDTGELMPLSNGQIVGVEITNLERGVSGDPGELQGSFVNDAVLGELLENTETGIYGQVAGGDADYLGDQSPIPAAAANEVKVGPAAILTTLSGSSPQQYTIEIEKVNGTSGSTRNMVLHITDRRLLTAAGGILQGMSGSPILQDGKLIGAVTHVFINSPQKGYGISISNMMSVTV